MSESDKSSFELITKHRSFHYFLVLATITSIIVPLYNAFLIQDFASIFLYVFIAIFSLFAIPLFSNYYLHKKTPFPRILFKPFESLDLSCVWPRNSHRDNLIDKIKNTKNEPVIVVGESGVGKSVLVETIVTSKLNTENWKIWTIKNYFDFKSELTKYYMQDFSSGTVSENGIVSAEKSTYSCLIIFDHFEQFFSDHFDNQKKREENKRWIKNFIFSILQGENNHVLISIRKEHYFDLKFLENFALMLNNCYHLTGMIVENESESISEFRACLLKICKNIETSDFLINKLKVGNVILPVEAQIVGCVLEGRTNGLQEITIDKLKEFDDKDDFVREFLKKSLSTKPRLENTALQILFALSIETTYRKSLSLEEIFKIIHKTEEEVEESLQWLIELHFVQEKLSKYLLSSDYLAERFNEFSGNELDPIERDNIIFFGDINRKGLNTSQIRIMSARPKFLHILSDYFIIFIVLVTLFRLISPSLGLDFWNTYNLFSQYQIRTFWLDQYYFPIFISHLLWSIYVTIAYRRFYYFLQEEIYGRIFSYITLITCLFSVVATMFCPVYWIFFIGLGGIAMGLKQLQLAFSDGLRPVSKRFFRGIGLSTLANSLVTTLVGTLFVFYFTEQKATHSLNQLFFYLSVFFLFCMMYFFSNVSWRHITRKGTSKMLGMFNRRILKQKQ